LFFVVILSAAKDPCISPLLFSFVIPEGNLLLSLLLFVLALACSTLDP